MSGEIVIPPEQRIKVVEREDGKARLVIFSQRPETYQFAVETDWEDEGYAWKVMSGVSGIYSSPEDAERDAKQEIRWVRDQLAKDNPTKGANEVPAFFVKAPRSMALRDFAEHLAKLAQSDRWEERDSVNYPDGYYFRQCFGQLEIVAQIADGTEFSDADFLIWVRKGEDMDRRTEALANMLVQSGYVLIG
ncbi:hypothetical protein XH89_29780 [Bradyrhizobium sp. CCBAU 53340]|uniref:hypothetical protein n=1 Tax=Bradyrhizobium sp. CCBAU 53340 TaxID=1325112 RepID=UPI00188D90C4|nr:hypothetical protein [Bradyrhizobium sp. CCBAU 53340]QOZ47208.1 hypothetical protein XH89_29780 [Bradyrhizobium sp. CCBAU 53340]